jgi:PleD family two-component response regulator
MRKKRILIIDNESVMLASARSILQADGYEVFSHSKGYSATEIARQLEPDLILLDVNRPDLTGEKLFAVLRANDSTRDIPVVFWSTDHEEVLRASAKRFGARGYVIKGSSALLRHCVAQVVGEGSRRRDYETSPQTGGGDGTY